MPPPAPTIQPYRFLLYLLSFPSAFGTRSRHLGNNGRDGAKGDSRERELKVRPDQPKMGIPTLRGKNDRLGRRRQKWWLWYHNLSSAAALVRTDVRGSAYRRAVWRAGRGGGGKGKGTLAGVGKVVSRLLETGKIDPRSKVHSRRTAPGPDDGDRDASVTPRRRARDGGLLIGATANRTTATQSEYSGQ